MSQSYPEITVIINSASDLIRNSHRTVVLSGAGISTASGIPDFRTPQVGLWSRFEPMEVASLTAFRHHPENFYKWLQPMAKQIHTAQPNPAHFALARLQNAGFISAIITQNIDGLHTKAGSKEVLEVHGSLSTMTCTSCYRTFPSAQYVKEYVEHCAIPYCKVCGSILKPDVILYDEQLPARTWSKAEEACEKCELLLVAGTSLEVMPSAKLPLRALEHGAHLIIINHAVTFMDVRADITIHADVAEILPKIADEVFNA
jgi:NAD-dependent deacetylase